MSFFVSVNGEDRECPEGSTVDTLLAQLQLDPATVLVELNRNVLAKEGKSYKEILRYYFPECGVQKKDS